MQKLTKRMFIQFIVLLAFLNLTNSCFATTYLDFNDFPVTNVAPGSVPGNSSEWQYSSGMTNNFPDNVESFGSGWLGKTAQSDGLHWFFVPSKDYMNRCYWHNPDTFGFLDIVAGGHSGNALRYTVTGGKVANEDPAYPCTSSPDLGTRLYNKESFTDQSQIYTAGKVGLYNLYFKRISNTGLGAQRIITPFNAALSANRMSFYIWMPSEQDNRDTSEGLNRYVHQTFQAGLFINGSSPGYHHYFNFLVRGGGWAKMQIEETTNGDNGSNGKTRYIPGLLKGDNLPPEQSISQGLWQFYFMSFPLTGITNPPYEIKLDDVVFDNDTYAAQNNETISNIAILYKASDKTWELSFNDKYKNSYAYSTYQVKYSFSPITNENWDSATPVNVIADNFFGIDARSDGKFQKWAPDFQGVWAPFSLNASDTENLTAGKTVYFAVKDISQNGNSQLPNDTIITKGYPYDQPGRGGRDYVAHADLFDWSSDQAALPLIKRISYQVGTSQMANYFFSDFSSLLSSWFYSDSENSSDLNSDNIVNVKDLGIMMSKWN